MHRESLTWHLAFLSSVLTELAVDCSQNKQLHSTVHHLHLTAWSQPALHALGTTKEACLTAGGCFATTDSAHKRAPQRIC